ncbi:IclR family transcriptional regulator [Amycolatopsis orientalis]|uniref:IclR family transcriptional regulator n=1 Tax=Amycolatopsis orientalis TaxID=31958 RepID=A0A193BUC4_AMYOR|nr:helix-turn-helix domain-containing protein [Amycolatopsis orientalis]ANN15826.1 IclR family transcriptional regulator [Amycolatopsis orientalis]
MNVSLSTQQELDGLTGGVGRTAMDKAMIVLASLITSEVALSLTELSHRTRLAKATVHRVLAVLQAHGMIVRSGDRYRPGGMVLSARRGEDGLVALLQQHSTPYLVDLHQLTGHTASISVLTCDSAQHVNQIFGHRTPRLPSMASVTSTFPSTAIAQVLHAYGAAGQSARGPSDPAADKLSEIRRIGLAHVDDAVHKVTSIAVPLTGTQRPTALALTGHFKQVNILIAARALRRVAFEFGRMLLAHRAVMNQIERAASEC